MIEIKKQSVWRSPDLEVVTELKSDQGMPEGGNACRREFHRGNKGRNQKTSNLDPRGENRLPEQWCERERSRDCGRDWSRDPSRDWSRDRSRDCGRDRSRDGVETGVETE